MRRRGFTIIELCCVTAIISILIGITTPVFSVYVDRARAAEALVQVETLAYLEQVRILELGAPIACGPHPEKIPTVREHWAFEQDACWADLGFRASGRVRFQYETRVEAPRGFEVLARGDVNQDGIVTEYRIRSATMELERESLGARKP